jgi:transketolase
MTTNHNFKNSSQRDAFWMRVYDGAKENKDIVVISADMGAPALDKFRRDLSGQFINTGIAEQNAILIAAGLALEGKKVFATAIAPFISLRCYEQIKVNLAGMNLPVTLVGVGAGFSYDDSGPTHHTLEDVSIMRILPNMIVNTATDSVMTAGFVDLSLKMSGPNYVRLDRKILPNIYEQGTDFSQGLAILKPVKEINIVATGNMVHRALEVSEEVKKHGLEIGVIDLYTLPINEKLFLNTINNVKKIVTLEEHTLPGGLGGAVVEVLADNNKLVPVKRIGLNLRKGYCYKYGGRKNIQSLCGLDIESIKKIVLDLK